MFAPWLKWKILVMGPPLAGRTRGNRLNLVRLSSLVRAAI